MNHRSYDAVFYTPLIGPLLAPTIDMPPGGAETQIYLLARALAAKGRRICLVTYETTEGLPATVDGVDIVVRAPLQWEITPGLRGRLAEIAMLIRTLGPIDSRVFVQRGTTIETGIVGLVAKLKRRRFVYSSANTIDFTWGDVASGPNVALFRIGVRLADEILVQTTEQVDLCERHFGRTPILVKSIGEPAEQRTEQPEHFLWIGKLTPFKRPLAFVELARSLPEVPFKMVCVPSEKESERLSAEVRRAAVDVENLELLGPRSRSDLRPLLDRAVAIVSSSEYEGMPNVFLEAWARGVPTIALSHDPDGAIERDGLGAVAHGSRQELTELTQRFWRQRHEQQELSRRCRAYMQREHDAEVIAEKWLMALAR